MKLSIVTPIHSFDGYRRYAASLCSQTEQFNGEVEIVLLANGEVTENMLPDGVEEGAIMHRKFTVIKGQAEFKNIGQIRNEALKLATGDLVYFLDCDDIVTPTFFESLNAQDWSDCDYIFPKQVRYCPVPNAEQIIKTSVHQMLHNESGRRFPVMTGAVFKRHVLDKLKFYEKAPCKEDAIHFLECYLSGFIGKYTPDVWRIYYVNYAKHSEKNKQDDTNAVVLEVLRKHGASFEILETKGLSISALAKKVKLARKSLETFLVLKIDPRVLYELPIWFDNILFQFEHWDDYQPRSIAEIEDDYAKLFLLANPL